MTVDTEFQYDDFADHFVAKWQAGDFPKAESGTTIVEYDGTHYAYNINPEQKDAFIEWVAFEWQTDNDQYPAYEFDENDEAVLIDETAAEFLNRIGVSVKTS